MTRSLSILLLALLLAGCGDWSALAPCTNIGSGCPDTSAEPIKPAPEKDVE